MAGPLDFGDELCDELVAFVVEVHFLCDIMFDHEISTMRNFKMTWKEIYLVVTVFSFWGCDL